MGLFKRASGVARDVVEVVVPDAEFLSGNDRRRRRLKEAPAGWLTTDALVLSVQSHRSYERVGHRSVVDEVARRAIEYCVVIPDGTLATLRDECTILGSDTPTAGQRATIAYNPADLSQFALLEDEDARQARVNSEGAGFIRRGVEAPVVVLETRPTGRVVRSPDTTKEAPRTVTAPWARGRAARAAAAQPAPQPDLFEFEVAVEANPRRGPSVMIRRRVWHEEPVLAAGTPGVAFYDDARTDEAYLQFAYGEVTVEQRRDALRTAFGAR